jgi:signal transduction histidine kinase/DNA-binding response OmpR family regulator
MAKEPSRIRAYLGSVEHALRLRGALADDPTACRLHFLVLAVSIWYGLWSLILLPLYPNAAIRIVFAVLLESVPVATLILLRATSLGPASVFYLGGTWATVTVRMAFDGGIHSIGQIFYVALPVLAIWLLGRRAALWMGSLCAGSALIFACFDAAGIYRPPMLPVSPVAAFVLLLQVILIAAVPVAQILRVLEETLEQSRFSRLELQHYKERLEQLVDQRTAELVEARDQALAANRAKSIFLANMSHELRTPLNAILGFSAIVRADAGLSEQHRKDLAIVGNSGEDLLGLIEDVLDMAKIEMGGLKLELASFDLLAMAGDVVNMLRETAHAKNLDLTLHISPQSPRFVRSDSGKLRQILANLVGNAVKYTEEGSIVVRVEAKPGDAARQVMLSLEVEDTGIGIAVEDQARIFEPFVQGGGARLRKGTGLGLSISRRFAECLGGTIQVESAPGRGSRFRLEAPADVVDAPEAAADSGHVELVIGLEPGQPDYRILIVEDQKENWLLMQRLLETAGFTIRIAENGLKAIREFQAWRPHFIWMDLRLPALSGLDAVRRIRQLEDGRSVKIVAVTASAVTSQREEALAAGFDDFLRKPFRAMEVFDCIARHLGVRFLYRKKPQPGGNAPAALRTEDLTALAMEARDELRAAIIALDRERIAEAIRRISEEDVALGRLLGHLADALAYTAIFNALESGDKSRS